MQVPRESAAVGGRRKNGGEGKTGMFYRGGPSQHKNNIQKKIQADTNHGDDHGCPRVLVRVKSGHKNFRQAEHDESGRIELKRQHGLGRCQAAKVTPLVNQCYNRPGQAQQAGGSGNHQEQNVSQCGADLRRQLFVVLIGGVAGENQAPGKSQGRKGWWNKPAK